MQDYDAEIFCGVIIDTLKNLSLSSKKLTPIVLHQALSEKQIYTDLLADRELARSPYQYSCQVSENTQESSSIHGRIDSLQESQIKKLQDFRVNLLSEFEDSLPNEFLASVLAIRELIGNSNEIEQILGFNEKILDILRAARSRTRGELEEFTSLVKELGKDLVAMESDLITSFSCTRETFENNHAFNNILAQNLEDTKEIIDISTNLIELKGFVASGLRTIKKALAEKHQYDNLQIQKATAEAKRLRERLTGMRREIVLVQRKAKALEEETLRDPLTGVHNRRAYEKRIQEQLALSERNEEIFSMLLIDIDHFKTINDDHGHWAGDRCLEELSKMIKKILRGTDFLARYGGEEFVAILPATDENGILIVAEKLRRLIERTRFHCQDEDIPLTVSIGGTTVKPSDQSAESIFKRVDAAMYEAKRNGRNRSVVL